MTYKFPSTRQLILALFYFLPRKTVRFKQCGFSATTNKFLQTFLLDLVIVASTNLFLFTDYTLRKNVKENHESIGPKLSYQYKILDAQPLYNVLNELPLKDT